VGVIDTKNSDEDDIVLAIFQKGYKLHDRIIRPAKVRVGKYVP
jgi:molecular chaperone GrpE (heat shock protein)